MSDPQPEKCLIAKIISNNHIPNKQSVISILKTSFKTKYPFSIKPWKHNFYNIAFDNKADVTTVLCGSPYFVTGCYVALLPWDLDKTLDEMEFSKGEFWVQVHDLPLGMLNSECAGKFAGRIGRLVEIGCVGEHEFLRVRVEVDVRKAFVPGFFIPRGGGRETWAKVKYEGLGEFCYNCGCLGHCEESCKSEVSTEKLWSSDMRASVVQGVDVDCILPAQISAKETPKTFSRAIVRHSSYSERNLTHSSIPPGFSLDEGNVADARLMLPAKQEELTDRLQVGEVLTPGSGTGKEVAKTYPHFKKVELYDASLCTRGRISVAKDIRNKLSNTPRYALFKETCFGVWLDVEDTTGDLSLVHAVLQTQYIPEKAINDDILFRIHDHELRFSREEFCLITGLPFGSMGQLREMSADIPFRDRVFGHIPFGKLVAVSDVQAVFQNSLDMLTDLDAIRICLLLLLEVGFNGRDTRCLVDVNLLRLVEDLDSWNTFPWGSYVWPLMYQQLRDSIQTRKHSHLATLAQGKVPTYKLSGFIWAFKIWIFEVFPFAKQFYLRDPDAIPRAIGWRNTRPIKKENIRDFIDFQQRFEPLYELLPTDAERSTPWWRASRRFFDEVVDVPPLAKRARVASPPSQEDVFPHHANGLQRHQSETTKFRSETTSSTNHQTVEKRLAAIEKDNMLLKHCDSWIEDGVEVIPRMDEKKSWAHLKYEGLSDFCYLCGCHGHCLESCTSEEIAKHAGKLWTTSSVERLQTSSTHMDYISPAQPSTIETPNSHSPSNYRVAKPIANTTLEKCSNHQSIPPVFSNIHNGLTDVNVADAGLSIKQEELTDMLNVGEILTIGNGTEKPSQVKEVDLYEAVLGTRGRISIAKDIQIKLINTPRYALFKETCFGVWLDVQYTTGDPRLVHAILQTQYIPEKPVDDEILFRIQGQELRFSREEFCLITGLQFGPMGRFHEMSSDIPFRARVFGHIPFGKSVTVSDVQAVFQNSLDMLTDLDAIRICLLLLLELGFNGRDTRSVIDVNILRLVEDLDSWNTFPWGSYIWPVTYQQLKDSIQTRRESHLAIHSQGKIPSYNLSGFIWAFQIWIFEVFPLSRQFNSRDPDAIPRAIGWRKKRPIRKEHVCDFIDFREGFEPLNELIPTNAERSTPWWRASRLVFEGVVDDVPPSTKRARVASPLSQEDLPSQHANGSHRHHTNTTMLRSGTTTSHQTYKERLAAVQEGVVLSKNARATSLPSQDLSHHHADDPHRHHSNTTITMSGTIEEQLVSIEKYVMLNYCRSSVEDRETT